MKTLALLFVMASMALARINTVVDESSENVVEERWTKSVTAMWPGKKGSQVYYYKVDEGKLLWSANGTNWKKVGDGTWTDKNGKWMKINGDDLLTSTDKTNWKKDNDGYWTAQDGKIYRLDEYGVLWMEKNQ